MLKKGNKTVKAQTGSMGDLHKGQMNKTEMFDDRTHGG